MPAHPGKQAIQATPTRTRGDDNPPPLPGPNPDFRFSFHPWDDLSVTKDGRLSITPAKDLIMGGLLGQTVDKLGIAHAGQRDVIVGQILGRTVIPDPGSYSYRYRHADPLGPAQFLDLWTSITWDHGRAVMTYDEAGWDDYWEAVAWSIQPSDRQIEAAEARSGHKLTHRP